MLENLIIKSLISNDEYARKVLPYLKTEYFGENTHKVLYKIISNYITKYNNIPSIEALKIELGSTDGINEKLYREASETLTHVFSEINSVQDMNWLLITTEKFCQDKALYNAIHQAIEIMDDEKSLVAKGSIPKLLQDALGITFDNSIGHDYIDAATDRFEFYHRESEKIPFDLELFNRITKGGVSRKTLTVILAACVHPDTKIKIRFKKKA